mmetsp:Transcript_17822/g.45666  ORF Transcript_17822/g.45666 Transcript_17822/m.45666 type:complete len:573 (+) Transcript_17822:707-2425(+)
MLQISFGTSQSTDQAVEMSRHMPAQHSLHRGVEVAGVAQQRPVHSGPVEAQHLEATCPLSSKQIEYPMQHALRSPHFHSTAATPEGETHMFRADSEPDWRRASQHSTYDSLRWPRQSAGSFTSMVPHHQPPQPAHEAAPSEWGFQQTGYGDLSGQYLQQNSSAQLRPLSEFYPAGSPDMKNRQPGDGSYVLANTTLAQSPVTVGSGGQTAISPAMQLACHQSHGQVETVSTWCVSGPVLDDAVGFFGSAQMAQHTVNYDRTRVSDSDGGHAPAGLHSSAVPAHRASDDLFDLAEGFTGAITLAPREGEFRLSESGATRPRVNLKISPEVGRLAKCNAAGKRVRPQHLIDALEQQVFVLESSKAEMLRGIMVDEAAVDRKTGAMTAKSSEILEQKFASLALAADAGESLGSQSTGAMDCTDGWRTAYTAELPGAAYTESVKYLSHLMTEYLKATGNRKGHLEDAIARNVSDVLRSLAECVRDMSGGSYASWIVSSTEENTQSRALEYPSHFIETVQMDAAQLAKLSMLVCFYMTSMDAMSIERVRACPLLPPKHLYQDVPMQTEGYLCHTCAL